jgi:Periplasmic protein involved in polysaccharide export
MALLGACAPISTKKLSVELPEAPPLQNYRLSPGDDVAISVFQEPDMASQQRVAQDGTVTIALAGTVQVAGKTVREAAEAIEEALKAGYLVNPQVTLNIITFSPKRVTVIGQVTNPGNFEIPVEEIWTLPQAIAMAGGNTRIGNLRRVLISRVEDGAMYEFKVNMMHPKGRQFLVKPGDIITVPESLF